MPLITFDEAGQQSNLTDFYVDRGVVFTGAGVDQYIVAGASGLQLVADGYDTYFDQDDPITATFTIPVNTVSITAVDVGEAGAILKAFDAAGSLIDSDEMIGTGFGVGNFGTLTVTGAAIAYVEISQISPSGADGMMFDDLSFEFVSPPTSPPEPPSIITGTDEADHLPGTFRNDTIFGKAGDDGIYAKEGNDTVEGGAGNDAIYGGTGNDQLHGQAGDDRVFGGQGSDKIHGEMGDDILGGGQGSDQLFGGMGHDTLYGGDNDDLLDGGMGNDVLFGGTGADTLWGGAGDDTLYGGGGADVFGFSANSGNDILYGFEPGDAIDLDGQSYTADIDGDGDLMLSLSGGGTITLFGITAVDQGWFV